MEKRCVRAGFSPRLLGALRPANHTLERWESNYPNRRFAFPWAAAFPDEWRQELRQLRELVYWRLIVELFEYLRSGKFRAEGRRIDVVKGSPKAPPDLWDNPDMLLLPSGAFRPPLGSRLPSFTKLTLSATAAAKPTRPTDEQVVAVMLEFYQTRAENSPNKPKPKRSEAFEWGYARGASKRQMEAAMRDRRLESWKRGRGKRL